MKDDYRDTTVPVMTFGGDHRAAMMQAIPACRLLRTSHVRVVQRPENHRDEPGGGRLSLASRARVVIEKLVANRDANSLLTDSVCQPASEWFR